MALLRIIVEPDPRLGGLSNRLRQKSARVDTFDDELRELARDMRETMVAANGVGLAAPQIGILKRLVTIHIPQDYDHEGDPELFLDLVNPEIIKAGGRDIAPEGCLSFPDLVGDVQRYATVVARARDLDGKELRIKARGTLARCLQHEIDHIDGILFFDRMEDLSGLHYPARGEEPPTVQRTSMAASTARSRAD